MKTNNQTGLCRKAGQVIPVFFLLAIPVFFSMAGQQDRHDKLESVLLQMEKVSRNFQSFAADITTKKYTAVLEEFDPPESGRFYYKRAKDGSALIRWEITDPGETILTIRDDEALIYQPKINSAKSIKLGKNKEKAEYLALGIGQSPADLKETFHISYRGSETVNGSSCSVLELRPKDPKTAAMYASIAVWINEETGVSTQMKLVEPFGDFLLVNFSDEKLNIQIDDSKFRQKLPENVDILRVN